MNLPDPPILIVTDRMQSADPLEARAEALFRGGCRWLSLREKDWPPERRIATLRNLIAAAAPFGARIGVHGDVEVAALCGCALHLPAGADAAAARERLGTGSLIGQSCHRADEVAEAARKGADYVTLGPVFASASKPGYEPLAAAHLEPVAGRAGIPVLALGGMSAAALPKLDRVRFAGAAIMGEAMRTPSPEAWFASILSCWKNTIISDD